VDLAAFFFVRGFPAEAARRAFPGAAVRGCRDMIFPFTNRETSASRSRLVLKTRK
jgi:hypothetical protein